MRDRVLAERSAWHIGVLLAVSYFPDNGYFLFRLELHSPEECSSVWWATQLPFRNGMEAAGDLGGLSGYEIKPCGLTAIDGKGLPTLGRCVQSL